MKLIITKSARSYGYVIWNKRDNANIVNLIGNIQSVHVIFNGLDLKEKNIDWKYHRISLGYKMTRALPLDHNMYNLNYANGILEVKSFHGK